MIHVLGLPTGNTAGVADAIEARASRAQLSDEQRRGADRYVNFPHANAAFMHYDQALAAGWPIATGLIEGAVRHLIADRLDPGGSRWGLEGAEVILKLRAVAADEHLETYWRFHVAQGHRCLYPTPGQDRYALTA